MTDSRNTSVYAFILGLALLKVVLFVIYGPIEYPDTATYTQFTDRMAGDSNWLHDVELATSQGRPVTAFRMIGYPALIYGAKWLAGANWAWLLVSVQLALSCWVLVKVYHLIRDMGAGVGASMVILSGHVLGLSFVHDQALLTDSIHANLWILAVIVMARGILNNTPPRLIDAAFISVCLAGALLLREAMLYLHVGFWPMMGLWLWRTRTGWGKSALIFTAMAAPFFATLLGYQAWNVHRTGIAFLTTGAETAALTPLQQLAERGVDVFNEDTPLDKVALETFRTYHWSEVNTVNARLRERYSLNSFEIAEMGTAKYFRVWREHPLELLQYTVSSFERDMVFLQFWPMRYVNEVLSSHGDGYAVASTRDMIARIATEFSIRDVLTLFGESLVRPFSALIYAVFVFYPPVLGLIRAHQRRPLEPLLLVMGSMWILYWSLVCFYALIDIETRYLMPVSLWATMGGVLPLAHALRWIKGRYAQ